VAAEIVAAGGTAVTNVADMAKPADIEAMIAQATQTYRRLDVLHNNAFGVPEAMREKRLARVADTDQQVWDYTLQVGLTAVMQATRAALPIMRQQGGGGRDAHHRLPREGSGQQREAENGPGAAHHDAIVRLVTA
jgi:NAD(P)-dependent dehydrogenase (short-subunit alcohol dehydrogenase family)